MTYSFHFRDLLLSEVIALLSFCVLLISSILIKKDKRFKLTNFLILGSSIAVLWQIINFFIPGILLQSPTVEDIEFVQIYGLVFTGLIPGAVLILSIGIIPLLFCYKNKESDYTLYLIVGAVVFIISIMIGIDLNNWLLYTISVIIIAISMVFYAFYGYKIKNWTLILFSILYFTSKLLFLSYL